MSEEKNKKPWWVPREQQEWKPNVLLQLLYRAWMVVFGAAKIALGAAATVVIVLAMCMLAFAGALGDYLQDEIMPQAGLNLEDFSLDQSSFVYYTDSDGQIQLLQQLHTDTNRRWANYEDIPEDMINATIAIEDKRFYEHQGVDWFTTIKAFANMFLGDDSKGGSTITQQLVKNLTQDDSVTVQRKLLELFRATEFEQRYDKETVLEWYLNYIYLGNGCYGVRSAAATYFGKELEMLTTAECASLISITNNPSIYDPYGDTWEWRFSPEEELREMSGAERNGVRKNWTLGEMVTQGWITWEEYEEARDQELVFKYGIDDGDRLTTCTSETCGYQNIANRFTSDGTNYYCPICGTQVSVVEDASQDIYSWFVDTVLEDVAKTLVERDGLEWSTGEGSTREIYVDLICRSGYHIYTTLDMDAQNQVDLIYEDLDQIPDTRSGQQLQSAIVVVDNRTGDIVAMSGGVGEKDVHDGWNIATDATLQTGSSIKPLAVYAPAFEAGAITPATVIKDLPVNYDDGPYPYNDNRYYSYSRTIQTGVQNSVNCVAANTLLEIGESYAFDFAKNQFGISGLLEQYVDHDGGIHSDLNLGALAMGSQTLGVSVRDMSCAYATFANNGVYREGRTFTKVFDSEGNLLIDNEQQSREILSKKTVDYMNVCLSAAVNRGTGTEANLRDHYTYGKTGTTNDFKDRWFCGFTKYYTAAVWCGYNIPERIYMTGGVNNASAVLWKKVMEPLHIGLEAERLYNTSNFISQQICLDSGMLATDACRNDVRTDDDCTRVDTVMVYWEDRVTDTCDKHVAMNYCVDGEGWANEWCQHFAGEEVENPEDRIKLEELGACKMTQKELDEMLKAEKHRLWAEFLEDDWVYLVDDRGRDVNSYQGLHDDLDQKVDAPYKVCSVHTEESWNAYLESQIPEETEPTVDPNAPTEPGEGSPLGDLLGGLFG